MNKILISNKISRELRKSISEHGFHVVDLSDYSRFDSPVASHADMLVYKIDDHCILTYKEYYLQSKAIFDNVECEVITCNIIPSGEYPNDIALNALKIGNTVYCKKDNAAPEIINRAATIVDVKQGYARCSCLAVDETQIITADSSMKESLANNNISVLKISAGNIAIEKYEYGFIGGASFVHGDTVYFFGDVYGHPDADKIIDVIQARGKKCLCLSNEPLFDYGGAVIV